MIEVEIQKDLNHVEENKYLKFRRYNVTAKES